MCCRSEHLLQFFKNCLQARHSVLCRCSGWTPPTTSLGFPLQEPWVISPLPRSIVIIKTPQFESTQSSLGSAHLWDFFVAHGSPYPSVQPRFFRVSEWGAENTSITALSGKRRLRSHVQLFGDMLVSYSHSHVDIQIRRGPVCWKYFMQHCYFRGPVCWKFFM